MKDQFTSKPSRSRLIQQKLRYKQSFSFLITWVLCDARWDAVDLCISFLSLLFFCIFIILRVLQPINPHNPSSTDAIPHRTSSVSFVCSLHLLYPLPSFPRLTLKSITRKSRPPSGCSPALSTTRSKSGETERWTENLEQVLSLYQPMLSLTTILPSFACLLICFSYYAPLLAFVSFPFRLRPLHLPPYSFLLLTCSRDLVVYLFQRRLGPFSLSIFISLYLLKSNVVPSLPFPIPTISSLYPSLSPPWTPGTHPRIRSTNTNKLKQTPRQVCRHTLMFGRGAGAGGRSEAQSLRLNERE